MPQDSPETQELKEWLEGNKFGQFFEKMYESGVETLDDLRALQTENDVVELAGPAGINMGVVFRRKFIRAVLSLNPNYTDGADQTSDPAKNNSNVLTNNAMENGDSKTQGISKPEQQSLNTLVTTIKEHTDQLRASRDDLASVKKQAEEAKQKLAELFDQAMGVLVVRKKHLENSLNSTETQTSDTLKQRTNDLQNSAKTLLKCKQTIEQQFKTTPEGVERQQFVTSSVETALQRCPPKEDGRICITFEEGKVPLVEFLENFGSVGVGRQKETSETS